MEHYFTNNEKLKSELHTINYKYGDFLLTFYSDNGVFSKNKIDYGSSLLVRSIIESKKEKYNNILDVGCGYGFMGITLAKILNLEVTLSDVNKRALHLADKNGSVNKVKYKIIESNCYTNIFDKYSLIISNPPIRAGKEIVLNILTQAKDYLSDDGELWFVMRKSQGVKSTIKHIEDIYMCEIIEKSKGFYIIKAKKR